MAKNREDLQSWLFSMAVLVRQKDTVEFSTIYDFLLKAYGDSGVRFLKGIVRALISSDGVYCELYLSPFFY
jgi:Na+/proline symporter